MYTTTALIFLFLYLIFAFRKNKKSSIPSDYFFIGMIPEVLLNAWRMHDFVTDFLEESRGTFLIKGPCLFPNMNLLCTADPANIEYILAKNFQNFGKGPDFKKIFELLGDGLFAAESESWKNQRKISKSFIHNIAFQQFSAKTIWNNMETKLIPILDSASETGVIVDLQDLFNRITFDTTCLILLGDDPSSLSKELPYLPHEKAMDIIEEAYFYRHFAPRVITKLMRFLNIFTEKNITKSEEAIHMYMRQCMSRNKEKVEQIDKDHDFLSFYKRALADKPDATNVIPPEIWEDLSLNLMFAGKSTISGALTWFFYLLLTNPDKEKMIREEIATHTREGGTWNFTSIEELKKLVYLHGALCETLRLFPPVPFQHKAPVLDDVLPSGHRVKANTKTILSYYSMGRMKSIWGEDCMEFKPERWISDTGETIFVPAFKFPAFSTGPRSCTGKDLSFVQLKIVAAAIISRFAITIQQRGGGGHPVVPRLCRSVTSQMENGLKVKISKGLIR